MSLRVWFIVPVVCNAFKSAFCINMAPTFLVSGDIQAKIFDKGLEHVFRWTWFDESLSYTDAKGNPQTTKVSNVFKKCANVCFHIRVI